MPFTGAVPEFCMTAITRASNGREALSAASANLTLIHTSQIPEHILDVLPALKDGGSYS